jgi:DNA replication protein DnaC
MTALSITLPFLLKELRLTSIAKNWQDKSQLAVRNSWDYSKYLSVLCEEEIADRYHQKTQRYIREAKLPPAKTLSSFDFKNTKINEQQIVILASNDDWIKNNENLLLFGPSGVGKTHLAAAIAYSLIEKGLRAKFTSTISMVQILQKAKRDLTLMDELSKLDKYKILILDDIGYIKKTENESSLLFELIAHRYESGSIIITANQPFSDWGNIFQDNMMTVAAIDRLIHHCTIISCDEESFRRKESIEKAEITKKIQEKKLANKN